MLKADRWLGRFQHGACLQGPLPCHSSLTTISAMSPFRNVKLYLRTQEYGHLNPCEPHAGLAQGPRGMGGMVAGLGGSCKVVCFSSRGYQVVWAVELCSRSLRDPPPPYSQNRDLDNKQTQTNSFWQKGSPMGSVLVFGVASEVGELSW